MIELRIGDGSGARLKRGLFWFIAVVIALWLAYIVREIWLPLLTAFLIALILDPLVDRLESRGWSRLWGAALIYAGFFLVTGIGLFFAVPAIVNQTTEVARSVSQYMPGDNETQTRRSMRRLLDKAHATPFVEGAILRASAQITNGFHSLSAYVGTMAQGIMVNLLWIVIVPILSFYALKDFHLIYARFLLLVPQSNRAMVHKVTNEVTMIFSKYLRSLMIVCTLNAVITAIVLAVLGVPNPVGLGAISGLLYMVPYFGAVITMGLIAGISLMALTIQKALFVALTIFILHSIIFDYVITPRIVGHNVGLHPILSMVALLVGGVLLGILGMILAVPIAATIQMILYAIFPKLAQPIAVPSGAELHTVVNTVGPPLPGEDAAEASTDMHLTIIEAVDTADDEAQTSASVTG